MAAVSPSDNEVQFVEKDNGPALILEVGKRKALNLRLISAPARPYWGLLE